MYYLKCKECEALSEVKSEYQTFCDHCGQKLENNFTNWKKRNPLGNFEKFQEMVCISDVQKNELEQAAKVKPRRHINPLLLVAGILVLGFLALGVVGYFVKPYVMPYITSFANEHQEEIISSLNQKDWKTYSCGSLGLTLQSPAPLVESPDTKNGVPEQYQHIFARMDVYSMENPLLHLAISANSILYVEGSQTSIDGLKEGMLNQFRNVPSNLHFTSSDQEYQINNIGGILTAGSFISDNAPMGFKLLTLANGLNMWQVMVIFDNSSDSGNATAQKVLDSVKINPA